MTHPTQETTDPNVVRVWAEARGGRPARVRATASDDPAHPAILRIDFPDTRGESLEEIDWDTFERTFREQSLAFVYAGKLDDGDLSRFGRFIRAEAG